MRILVCLILLLSVACTAFAASAPEQAVRNAQRAIDTKNADLFDQVVDTQSILDAATDMLLAEADKPDGRLPPMLSLMISSIKDSHALAGLRALIAQEARAFVNYGVLSGSFAGKPDHSIRPGGMLAPLFSDASLGRKELRVAGPASPIGQEQNLLPVELKDHGNGHTYPLLLRLRWTPPDWRIMEVVNLPDIWNQIRSEAEAQR
ncbi:MAG: hypothetical protein LBC79_07270 [Deltaproteobacteria bacterium]|nr:hypothetical protein [Deltaproteobacteria bacterium]